jgi:hypothetical protein
LPAEIRPSQKGDHHDRLLAGEKADAFVTAAATLADQGDLALALAILTRACSGTRTAAS